MLYLDGRRSTASAKAELLKCHFPFPYHTNFQRGWRLRIRASKRDVRRVCSCWCRTGTQFTCFTIPKVQNTDAALETGGEKTRQHFVRTGGSSAVGRPRSLCLAGTCGGSPLQKRHWRPARGAHFGGQVSLHRLLIYVPRLLIRTCISPANTCLKRPTNACKET